MSLVFPLHGNLLGAALTATGALAAGAARGTVTKRVQTSPPAQGLLHFDITQDAADGPAAHLVEDARPM